MESLVMPRALLLWLWTQNLQLSTSLEQASSLRSLLEKEGQAQNNNTLFHTAMYTFCWGTCKRLLFVYRNTRIA